MKIREITADEMQSFALGLLELRDWGLCIRCGARTDKDPGCGSHDWPWEHAYCSPPEWAIAEGYEAMFPDQDPPHTPPPEVIEALAKKYGTPGPWADAG